MNKKKKEALQYIKEVGGPLGLNSYYTSVNKMDDPAYRLQCLIELEKEKKEWKR